MTPQTNSLYTEIETLLKSIPEFLTEEKELRYNKIKEMAENGDVKLLESLMKDEKIKSAFFTPILDSFVFKTKEFKEFLDYSSSNNSYSQYLGKKIGLYIGDSALTDRSEVVLNFPFKDCVLEGGQRKEDGLDAYFTYDEKTGDYVEKTDKRREVFFNETLAKDEIDSLFSPKAFCNVKKFIKDGEETYTKFERNSEVNIKRGLSEDTITDNLVIKGNNLLALHSLKKEFEGKVKLIYIDPPYNTGSDDFKYNDNFNHSSWLTFMKNRLEVARDLLRDDGCIFVQCDYHEQAYIEVLLDSVFERENLICILTCKVKSSGGLTANDSMFFDCSEYIHGYAKNLNCLTYNELKTEVELITKDSKTVKNYNQTISNINLMKKEFIKKVNGISYYKLSKENFEIKKLNVKDMSPEDFYNIRNDIFRTTALSGGIGNTLKRDTKSFINSEDLFIYEYIPTRGKDKGKLTSYFLYKGGKVSYLKNYIKENHETHTITKLEGVSNIILGDLWQGIANEGGISLNNGKKPENLMKLIIEAATNEKDIILDYHLGSGTTAAVSHKMNRQYIGIEQLDYGENDSVVRLKNVINGDTTGISKSVNWQGGGSFVYLELAEKNEKAMRLISACKNYDELVSIFENLSAKYFLHYNVRVNEFINKICKEDNFKKLSLERQKEIFMRMMDLNQLYVNLDDRNDKDSGLTENDIKATEDFYQISKDGQ